MLRSHSLVKRLWMLSFNSNGNQSHKPAAACGRSLFHSRSFDSDIHSNKKAGKSSKKVMDDEPDFNIDLENELKWLNDRVRSSTGQSARDYSKTPVSDPQETSTRGWHKDRPLLKSQLLPNVLPQNSHSVGSRVFPAYREQCARVSSDRRPPPLTSDVAVEVVTSELKAVFGLDRYYAHRVASWLRRPHYASPKLKVSNLPQLPPALDTGPAGTKALVARTRNTIQVLHQLGALPWQLLHLPMLIKMCSEELVSKAPLLVGPGLFSRVSEGLPLLLLPIPSLKRTLKCLHAESRYLSEHRNRLYFMADALNVCVGTVCCGFTVAGVARMLNLDLVKLARAVDIFNYYRLERRYILSHMDIFLISLSHLRQRYDLMVRVSNPPNVVAALHAASLLPAHMLTCTSCIVSHVLEDGDMGSIAGLSGNTDAARGRENNTGQNGNTAAALRVGKRGTRGYLLPNGGGDGNCSLKALKVPSGGLGLKEGEAGGNGVAAVDDPLVKHAPFVESEGHLSSHSTALRETVGDDIITTPPIDYYEKNIYNNYAMINDHAMKSKPTSRSPSATDNTRPATACSTAAVYSLSAAELEEVLKDYVPPPVHIARMSKSAFRALYNRKLKSMDKNWREAVDFEHMNEHMNLFQDRQSGDDLPSGD